MKSTLFLRIASVLAFVHCLLHTVGGVFGKPTHGADEVAVRSAMKSHQFDVMGSMRSYWDFFFGYGLIVTITLLVQAILFWQLAAFAKSNPAWVRPIAGLFCLNFLGMAVVSGRYFFIAPAVTEVLIAICLALTFFGAAPAQTS